MRLVASSSASFLIIAAGLVVAGRASAEAPCGGCQPPAGYTRICTASDLNLIRTTPSGSYFLCQNINVYSVFTPLPTFTGNLDGNHHGILGANISLAGTNNVGLFTEIAQSATVSRLAVKDERVTGNNYVGALAGINRSANVVDVSVDGSTVFGAADVGGVVGWLAPTGRLLNARTSGSTVHGTGPAQVIGGVVGYDDGLLTYVTSTALVDGFNSVGGIAGYCSSQCIINYGSAAGQVTGNNWVGGVVGALNGGIGYMFVSTRVTGTSLSSTGGLVGTMYYGGGVTIVVDSRYTGVVNSGWALASAINAGPVSAQRVVVAAANTGISPVTGSFFTVSGSFYDKTLAPSVTTYASSGKTTTELQTLATYTSAGYSITAGNPPAATTWVLPSAQYAKPAFSYCGDNRIASDESCDDGNVFSGDGCSNTCAIEGGFRCMGDPSDCTGSCKPSGCTTVTPDGCSCHANDPDSCIDAYSECGP
jgi:cysteine-rich repeat protein